MEVQEFQPLVTAPTARDTAAPSQIYARQEMNPAVSELWEMQLSKAMTTGEGSFGYMEHWCSFASHSPYFRGTRWSSTSLSPLSSVITARRANVGIGEVVLPRRTIVRSLGSVVTMVPFVWCFDRMPP